MRNPKRLHLPKRLFVPGIEIDNISRVAKHSSNKTVLKTVEDALEPEEFQKLEDSFLGKVIAFARREEIKFSSHLVHHFLQRRILTRNDELWFAFAEQPMRFSLREFVITTGLPLGDESQRHSRD